jgi:hypothetical protein
MVTRWIKGTAFAPVLEQRGRQERAARAAVLR